MIPPSGPGSPIVKPAIALTADQVSASPAMPMIAPITRRNQRREPMMPANPASPTIGIAAASGVSEVPGTDSRATACTPSMSSAPNSDVSTIIHVEALAHHPRSAPPAMTASAIRYGRVVARRRGAADSVLISRLLPPIARTRPRLSPRGQPRPCWRTPEPRRQDRNRPRCLRLLAHAPPRLG